MLSADRLETYLRHAAMLGRETVCALCQRRIERDGSGVDSCDLVQDSFDPLDNLLWIAQLPVSGHSKPGHRLSNLFIPQTNLF